MKKGAIWCLGLALVSLVLAGCSGSTTVEAGGRYEFHNYQGAGKEAALVFDTHTGEVVLGALVRDSIVWLGKGDPLAGTFTLFKEADK